MKGFVATPPEVVDLMVDLLFRGKEPTVGSALLDPGCGTGEFIDGVIRWCDRRKLAIPRITGVESDPRHFPMLRAKYSELRSVNIEHADFLEGDALLYDFIIGNPPYVAITGLSEDEKARYRARYTTAYGRFDLYILFFEQALRGLASDGRLAFITPEKFLYVESAGPLRELLAHLHVEEIRLLREDTFAELVTYPTVTILTNSEPGWTQVVRRDGTTTNIRLPAGSAPWLPYVEGATIQPASLTLKDLCLRISCGVATGADNVFVLPVEDVEPELWGFARPTVAGRQLSLASEDVIARSAILVPYDADGRLLAFEAMGRLGAYLNRAENRRRLLARTCVNHKPWYAFHETPPMRDMMHPKILCKDIGQAPHFWLDRSGEIIPRHSVYYIVPGEHTSIEVIADYLRSQAAHEWLTKNCQRAANGFLRLQARVLGRLPVPDEVGREALVGAEHPVSSTRPLHHELSVR